VLYIAGSKIMRFAESVDSRGRKEGGRKKTELVAKSVVWRLLDLQAVEDRSRGGIAMRR